MEIIKLVSIKDAIDYDFFIPRYQRGYRWQEQQVKELLEDIKEFCDNGAKGIYCLQPLVVKKNGERWDVIDGQQRLTTIYIILSCLNEHGNFSLRYETREKSGDFLRDIVNKGREESEENIDFYHMFKACEVIKAWLSGNETEVCYFSKVFMDQVKFIWYNIDKQNPIEVFKRLNIDKIPLTSSELVKALLLNRTNFDDGSNYERTRLLQQEMASEWDKIEATLQNDEFWLFFHDDADTPETRIEYLLELICNQELLGTPSKDIGNDRSRVFRYFYDYFHREKHSQEALKVAWQKVKEIYDTLYEWFTNLEMYHYVGYLLARPAGSAGVSQQDLLNKYLNKWNEKGMMTSAFTEYLVEEIKNTLDKCRNLNKEYETSGNPKTQCRPLLLLHNVETVIRQGEILQNQYGQRVFNKFPFNLYKKEKWDVEHIDSNTANDLDDFNSQKEWLLTSYEVATDEQKKRIEEFCKNVEKDDKERNKDFNELSEEIYPQNSNDALDEEEKNKIGNFALLDSGTNRGYGNAIFPAKRRCIIGKERGESYPVPKYDSVKGGISIVKPEDAQSAFIPPCTKQVFLKYYSPTSGSMVRWSESDARAYVESMHKMLLKFGIIK